MDNIKKTTIEGLLVLERPIFADNRGFFHEVFHLDELESVLGQPFKVVQVNHSQSLPGVIRGIHADTWNKLIYPVTGSAFAAITDVRPDSPTFGKVETFSFDDNHRYAIFVSKNLGNSMCAVGPDPVNYLYFVDDYFRGVTAVSVAYDDPDLNVAWPVEKPILSDKDLKNPTLRSLYPEKFKQ